MAISIYPSESSLGTFRSNPTNRLREYQYVHFAHALKQSGLYGHLVTGGAVSIGSGLSVDIAAGEWMCYGRWIGSDTTVNVPSLTANQTNFIFLVLSFSGSMASGVTWVANTTGTPPSYSVCVGKAVCGASTVTSVETPKAPTCGGYEGAYTGDGTTDRLVFLGFQPQSVEIWSAWGSSTGYFFSKCGSAAGIFFLLKTSVPEITRAEVTTSTTYCPAVAPLGFLISGDGSSGLNQSSGLRYFRVSC